jgi:hypothetical protein
MKDRSWLLRSENKPRRRSSKLGSRLSSLFSNRGNNSRRGTRKSMRRKDCLMKPRRKSDKSSKSDWPLNKLKSKKSLSRIMHKKRPERNKSEAYRESQRSVKRSKMKKELKKMS